MNMYEKTLQKIKESLTTNYFEELIDKYILNNTHASLLTLKPEKGLAHRGEIELQEKLANYKASLTDNEVEELVKATKDFISGKEEFEITPSGEEGVKILKAISGLGDFVSNCNLPNQGQMLGVEDGTIVETNAVFSADSVKPVVEVKLDGQILALVNRVASAQTEVVRAILDEDYDRVFNSFVNDPLVTISIDDAKELFLDMIENTKHLIPRSEEYLRENGR
jgi:alpha-galactosidase